MSRYSLTRLFTASFYALASVTVWYSVLRMVLVDPKMLQVGLQVLELFYPRCTPQSPRTVIYFSLGLTSREVPDSLMLLRVLEDTTHG